MHLSADRIDNPSGWRYWNIVAGTITKLGLCSVGILCDFADEVLTVIARLFDVQASYVC